MASNIFDFSQNSSSEDADPIAKLIAVGQQALQSGKVSPKKAAKNLEDLHPVLKAAGISNDPLANLKKKNKSAVDKISKSLGPDITVNTPTSTEGVWAKTEVPLVNPVGKGSGLTNTAKNYTEQNTDNTTSEENSQNQLTKNDETSGTKSLATTTQHESIPEWEARVAGIRNSPVFQEQAKGIQDMQDILAMQAQAPSDALSGALATAYGSLGYNPQTILAGRGMTPEQVRANILNYQGKIQDDKRDLMSKILEAEKGTKVGTLSDTIFNTLGKSDQLQTMQKYLDVLKEQNKNAQTREAKATDPSIARGSQVMPLISRAVRDVQKTFNKDIEPFNKSLNFASEIESIVNNTGPGSKLALKSVETLIARARTEVGNLSYYEQAGTAVPRDVLSNLTQKIETLTTGELTPEVKREILGLVGQYKQAANAAIASRRDIAAKQGMSAYGGIGLTEDTLKSGLPAADTNPTSNYIPKTKQENMVSVISPDGKKGKIPASKLKAAIAKGYKEAK